MNRFAQFLAALLIAFGIPDAAVGAPERLPDEVQIDSVEFVRIPEGYFWYSVETDYPNRRAYGSEAYRQVKVWLSEFYIAKYEARARDFVRFMNSAAARQDWIGDPEAWMAEADGCTITYVPGKGFRERYLGRDLPATAVSWDLAHDFARSLGFRLPTEAEWQKAARGTDRRIWPWGDAYPDETYANIGLGVVCSAMPVTSYPKGKSPFGVYNMAGNVAEWTANWLSYEFDKSLVDGMRDPPLPRRPSVGDEIGREFRFVKGGRWGGRPGSVTIAMREVATSDNVNGTTGVRFAVDSHVVRQRLSDGRARKLDPRR